MRTDAVPSVMTEEEKAACWVCRKFRPIPRDMCGRVRDRLSEYVGLYDSEFEQPQWWTMPGWKLFDASRGMHDDLVGIVKRFESKTLKWFHLMVKHDAYATFREKMNPIREEIALLPYWCLCDGLTAERVTHRHMILACTLESAFEDVWKKEVKYDLPSSPGVRCKHSVRIKDAFHLVNCIRYVSQKRSSCDGVLIRDEVDEENVNVSHFHLNCPQPKHSLAFMCVLFEGGLEKLLVQQNRSKNVVDWMDVAVEVVDKYYHRRWGVPVRETGLKFLNCVIPLRRDTEPTEDEEEGPMYLTWMNKTRLYLKENPDLLKVPDDDWYARQVAKGNTFQRIGDEIYIYERTQQNMMNQLHKRETYLETQWRMHSERNYHVLEEKNKELVNENKRLREENDTVKRAMEVLKLKMEVLQTKLDALKEEMIRKERDYSVVVKNTINNTYPHTTGTQ